MRKCCKCKKELDDENFNKGQTKCRICQSEYNKKYYNSNKEYFSKKFKKYYNQNINKMLEKSKCAYHNNKAKANQISSRYRDNNLEYFRIHAAKRRGNTYNSINKPFRGSDGHHLYLENNNDFVINIPTWLHEMIYHNSKTRLGMDTINAIALDYWINEEIYEF